MRAKITFRAFMTWKVWRSLVVSLSAPGSQTVQQLTSKSRARRGASRRAYGSKVRPKPLRPCATVQGHLRRALAIIGKCAHREQAKKLEILAT
jgi:hypothetical protein